MEMKKILQILSFEGIAKKATEEKVKSNRKAKRERERDSIQRKIDLARREGNTSFR